MSDNVVLFGAEFNSEGVNKGVEEIVSGLEKAKEAEAALIEEIIKLGEEFDNNEKAIKKTTEALDEMTKTSGKGSASVKEMNKQLDDLKKKNEALKGQLKSAGTELENNTKKLKNFNTASDTTKKSQNEITKALGKFTDATKLGGKLVEDYGKQLFKLGKAAIEGFAIGFAVEALPALLDFIQGINSGADGLQEYAKQAKIVSEIGNKTAELFSGDFARLELIRAKLNDTNISQAERIKLAKEYNKTADKANQIDITQIDNLKVVNAQIEKQIALLRERAQARAAESVIAEKAEALFKKQLDFESRFSQFTDKELAKNEQIARQRSDAASKQKNLKPLSVQELFAFADLPEDQLQKIAAKNKAVAVLLDDTVRAQVAAAKKRNELITSARKGERVSEAGIAPTFKELTDAQEEFERALKVGAGLTNIAGLLSADNKQVENVFIQKLKELRARLAQASANVFSSEPLIKADFAARLDKDLQDIANLVKAGSLTKRQAEILDNLLKQINEVEVNKALEDFRQKRIDAIQKINDTITQLQFDAATKRIEDLHNEFDRERAAIELDGAKTNDMLAKQQRDLFRNIDDQVKQGVISLEQGEERKQILSTIFGDLIDEAKQAQLRRQIDLNFKQFTNFIQTLRDQFENVGIGLSEEFTKEIQEASQQFVKGQITYEQYQKKLTEITRRESRERRKIQLQAAQEELDSINKRLTEASTEAQQKELQNKQRALRTQIAQLNREIAQGDAEDEQAAQKERLDRLVNYVQAIGNLAQAIGSFWNQVNQAEARALDRSIALQQKRVDFARQIAEKGNTEFLELEQKRLDELERKREENANRQLAIDNALALSQATVAAITAIAQAVSTGSPFAALAAVAAVIGAIAAAYQFVNSLQPPVAQFYTGTEYVHGASGKDKVPAKLTQGERVVTAQENAQYWDTLTAIHNREIPPEVLNAFVNGYPGSNMPIADFDRLAAASNYMMGADSEEVLNKLAGLNATMEDVVTAVSAIAFHVKMDSEGFSAALSNYQKKKRLQRKS